MTATTDLVLARAAAPGPRRRGRWVLVLLLVAGLLALAVWQAAPKRSVMPLDPENVGSEGTRALVEVLRHEGVQVDVVRSRAALEDADIDDRTTLVVSATPLLTTGGLEAAKGRFRDAGAVRLLGLRTHSLAVLDIPFRSVSGGGDELEARCSLASASTAGTIGPVDTVYERTTPAGSDGSWRGCFWSDQAAALVSVKDAGRDVELLAAAGTLTNERITTAGDAAFGLRLLGAHPRVVWFAPTTTDLAQGDTTVREPRLAPDWLVPLVVLLVGTVILTMFWRGRRLGRLATEPMPVLVQASETTTARGRLYRRSHGRAHAAGILRDATARRLRERLGIPATASPQTLADAVAAASGRSPADVLDLLAGPEPATDTQLAEVARDLAALEEGIRP